MEKGPQLTALDTTLSTILFALLYFLVETPRVCPYFVRPNVIITASLDHYPLRESLKYTLLVQITDSEVHAQLLYKIFQIPITLSLWEQMSQWTNPVLNPYC